MSKIPDIFSFCRPKIGRNGPYKKLLIVYKKNYDKISKPRNNKFLKHRQKQYLIKMILTGPEITKQIKEKKIEIFPFDPKFITTNSYDLTLGNKFIRYKKQIIDPKTEAEYDEFEVSKKEGLLLMPGDFILGHTQEIIGSDHFVPIIHAKSGTARMGLFVHVTADLIDIGSHGCSTLQLFATLPVKIYPGEKIAQVSFWVPKGKIILYKGKYQGSLGPRPSMTYLDYQNGKK